MGAALQLRVAKPETTRLRFTVVSRHSVKPLDTLNKTSGHFQQCLQQSKVEFFQPKHDLHLTLSKLFLCLDLIAAFSQHKIKLNNKPKLKINLKLPHK